jgi:hypothetical protein
MADVSVTAASVVKASDTLLSQGILGATVTAGQTVYLDTSTSPPTYKLADANASATTATLAGIAMNGGATNQPVSVATGGTINPGFTVGVGTVYVQSANAGGIAPASDLAQNWYTSIVGIGLTASSLKIVNVNSGVAVP